MGRIVLNNVTKSFGETQVIPPLDLTIEEIHPAADDRGA